MSLEQQNNQIPEQNPVDMEHADKFDAEGSPRFAQTFEDGEIFYGSKKEIQKRTDEKREELHNK
ncbi:MAG: hypothetical protein QG674_246 [Patescibacteria group bacterium]|jgi:hypothetical protein|nr:hypothetical protein [Patescibacteria group bacterium]